MNEIASWLAMRPVYVKCLNKWESEHDDEISIFGAAAYVEGEYNGLGRWVPQDHTVVAWPICQWFMGLATGKADGYWGGWVSFSVLALTHESGHLRGWQRATLSSNDEASTERWALRHVHAVALRIGLSPEAAVAVLWYAVKIHLLLPAEYRAADCSKPWLSASGQLMDCGASP